VGYIPDSLISEYKTRNGRTVYDGGGIRPDVNFEPEEVSQMSISLLSQNVIFDYATKFAFENPTIKKVDDFIITDTVYDDFVAFALEQDFNYETESERELKEFIKILKREKFYKRVEDEVEALQNQLIQDKEEDLYAFKDEVIQFLRDEIVGRYYYEEGQIQANLKDDEQLKKAIEILKDSENYYSILSVNEKEAE
jgi:carboxyl-terminal processing protease